ncbi:MAG TPA: hypothetical protein VGJ75_12125 [Dongiaceae bacterium]|jgi:hypothetical protein
MAAAEYRKLIVIVWLVVAAALAALWGPRAWHGLTWDTDDFMRLVQVRDLLAGQAWSDLTQHRLNPPDGTLMHWSRLADAPIALVTLALSPLLGAQNAITVAAMLLPPLYFLLFLTLFAFAARLMLGAARSPIALLVAIGGSISIVQFVPGRVDHHGLQLTAMMAALMLLLIGLARARWRQAIAWAGVPFALSVWIGAETLPLIAAWFGALGLAWCYAGGNLARHGAVAGLLGAAIGVAILLTSEPPASWLRPACDAFSVMPIGVLALIGIGFAGMAIFERWAHAFPMRALIAGACGIVAAGGFAIAFPVCLHGGYALVDPVVELHWLSRVSEAMSLTQQFRAQPFGATANVWTPLLGLAYCLWRVRFAQQRGRILWGAIAVLLLTAFAMMAWQVRAVTFAQEFALVPVSGLITDILTYLRAKGWRRLRYAAAAVLLFVCSFVFWPSAEAAYRAVTAPTARASDRSTAKPPRCVGIDTLAPLQASAPTLILSYIDLGSMLLFNTPHSVLAGPYHRDNAGLKTTIELFRSHDDGSIERTMRDRGIGWIVTCPGTEDRTSFRTGTNDGLAERLAAGRVPDYLEEIDDPAWPDLRFYRLRAGE